MTSLGMEEIYRYQLVVGTIRLPDVAPVDVVGVIHAWFDADGGFVLTTGTSDAADGVPYEPIPLEIRKLVDTRDRMAATRHAVIEGERWFQAIAAGIATCNEVATSIRATRSA